MIIKKLETEIHRVFAHPKEGWFVSERPKRGIYHLFPDGQFKLIENGVFGKSISDSPVIFFHASLDNQFDQPPTYIARDGEFTGVCCCQLASKDLKH